MAFIRQVYSTANGTEKALQLAGEEIFFPLGFGNSWGKLRIGLRCYVQGFSSMQETFQLTNLNYNDFRIGVALCNGTKGFLNPSPTDVLALYGGQSNAYFTTLSTAAIPWTANVSNGYTFCQKRGSVSQHTPRSNSIGALTVRSYASTNVYWSPLYFDFDRVTTSGSIVYTVIARTSAQVATVPNLTFAEFFAGLNVTTTPTNMTNLSSTSQTTAYTGTLNYFDTLSIFCNSTANIVLEFSHVAVARQL